MLIGGALATPVRGQASLYLVNDETTVRRVSFRFVDSQTFDAGRLRSQIATDAPSFFDRVWNGLALLPGFRRRTFPFDPVTLQKDVVRLRRFYNQNGFPSPRIDYPASQLDTTANAIHVIFTVQEGPPLIIQRNQFLTADGRVPLDTALAPPLRSAWGTFRTRTASDVGARFTEFKQTQIEDQLRTWLRNQGFAFADVQSEARIDSSAHTVDLTFLTDAGPQARVSEIVVEGNRSVSASIVRRELPFEVGDRFSAEEVTEGQRRLFDLNLFRVALADVPDQPRDSTVMVRYRVRENELRTVSGQVGYGTQPGVTLETSWRHRNFYGNARNLVVGLVADTGYPQNPPGFLPNFLAAAPTRDPDRRFRASVTLRQPYFLTPELSSTIEPFVLERINPALGAAPDRFLGLSERQFGINTTLVYDLLPFRSISLRHSLARIEQFSTAASPDDAATANGQDDLFDKSVFALNGTFGKTDDFINPSRGYILRPTVELGGALPLGSDIDFVRGQVELSGYLPLTDQVELAGRVFGGYLWPLEESRTRLTASAAAQDTAALRGLRTFQNRFSEFLLYGGGGTDVRGWTSQLGGGKVLQQSSLASGGFVYRPTGSRAKIGVNLEARLPFPGLGSSWRTAVFLDAAYLDDGPLNLAPPPSVSPLAPVDTTTGRRLLVGTDPTGLIVGTGGGVRYDTPFGFVRVDVAYKMTPDVLDLRRPGDVGRAVERGALSPVDAGGGGGSEGISPTQVRRAVPDRFVRRFRLHFGIGRSF